MTRTVLVGVDVGTTAAKATVVDLDGRELAQGRAQMPWRQVSTGAEMHPQALLDTAFRAVDAALAGTDEAAVSAVGVTSMAETGVLLDSTGTPVAPAIAWHDARGGDEAGRLADELGADTFARRTGLRVSPLCSASKYLWLRGHHEGVDRARRWLNVAEWIVAGLGGEPYAELSLASRTGWLDQASRDWWPEVAALCELPAGLLTPPQPAGTPAGTVRCGPPRLRGAVLAVGGHDHLCGAVGVGATGDGDVFDSCGTAEAFIAPVAPAVPAEEVARLVAVGVDVGWHTVPGRQALLGAQREGLALRRVLDLLGIDEAGRDALDAAALDADTGALRLTGLEDEEAVIAGIGWHPTPGRLWRAALEAVSDRAAEILATVETAAGPTRRLVVGGGWARSAALRAVKRDRLGPFEHPRVDEPGARGAALLAAVAAGHYGGIGDLPRPS